MNKGWKGILMKTNRQNYVQSITISGLLLALGILLPRAFHMFAGQKIGQILLPMHFNVFIAGIFLGPWYGILIGILTPLLNSLFGAPPFPMNLIMAFELAAYGFFSGLFMSEKILPKIKVLGKDIKIYLSLLLSMLIGRAVYTVAFLLISGKILGNPVPKLGAIIISFTSAIPGILLQLILVPVIVLALKKVMKK